VLLRVLETLSLIPADEYVLACPEDCLEAFTPIAKRGRFAIFAGSKNDVLNRYCSAIRYFGIAEDARIIRATGDNPFVFAAAAAEINREASALGADYAGYTDLPYGAGVESVLASALLRAEKEGTLETEREHVCPYLYGNPARFKLHRPLAPKKWQYPALRLTIDTKEDYENACRLYNILTEAAGPEKRYHEEEIIKHASIVIQTN
jgi:spore coat polysaccharide biosynthesis protein SpsF